MYSIDTIGETLTVFDSYGRLENLPDLLAVEIIKNNSGEGKLKLVVNRKQYQPLHSTVCASFVLFFLLLRARGNSLATIENSKFSKNCETNFLIVPRIIEHLLPTPYQRKQKTQIYYNSAFLSNADLMTERLIQQYSEAGHPSSFTEFSSGRTLSEISNGTKKTEGRENNPAEKEGAFGIFEKSSIGPKKKRRTTRKKEKSGEKIQEKSSGRKRGKKKTPLNTKSKGGAKGIHAVAKIKSRKKATLRYATCNVGMRGKGNTQLPKGNEFGRSEKVAIRKTQSPKISGLTRRTTGSELGSALSKSVDKGFDALRALISAFGEVKLS